VIEKAALRDDFWLFDDEIAVEMEYDEERTSSDRIASRCGARSGRTSVVKTPELRLRSIIHFTLFLICLHFGFLGRTSASVKQ
jgi:hypothetical protein